MISEGGGDDDGVIAEHSPPLEAPAKEGATSIISSVPSAPGSLVPPPSVECTEERLASSCLFIALVLSGSGNFKSFIGKPPRGRTSRTHRACRCSQCRRRGARVVVIVVVIKAANLDDSASLVFALPPSPGAPTPRRPPAHLPCPHVSAILCIISQRPRPPLRHRPSARQLSQHCTVLMSCSTCWSLFSEWKSHIGITSMRYATPEVSFQTS